VVAHRVGGVQVLKTLIEQGKASSFDIDGTVYVKLRKFTWTEGTNVTRTWNLGGVSQGQQALGGMDLETLGAQIEDLVESTTTPGFALDTGDSRLLRQHSDSQAMARSIGGIAHGGVPPLAASLNGTPTQTHVTKIKLKVTSACRSCVSNMLVENVDRTCLPKRLVEHVCRKCLSKLFAKKVCPNMFVDNVYR
jgi:hypothetical protein